MKVRILSGNEKGAVVEMPQLEAEAALSTGYAEEYKEPEPEPKAKRKPEPEPEKPAKRR